MSLLRAVAVRAALAVIALPVWAQVAPRTQSGPFWRHTIEYPTLGGCTLTLNGRQVTTSSSIVLDHPTDRAAAIKVHYDCDSLANTAGLKGTFDGTLTLTFPAETPAYARPASGSLYTPVREPLETGAALNGTFTYGAPQNPSQTPSALDVEVSLSQRTPVQGEPSMDRQASRKGMLPGGSLAVNVSGSLELNKLFVYGLGTAHDFADGRDTGQVATSVRFDMGSRFLAFNVVTEYRFAYAKIGYSPQAIRMLLPPGRQDAGMAEVEITNIGGGLLDFQIVNRSLTPGSYYVEPGVPAVKITPDKADGIVPRQSVKVNVSVDTQNLKLANRFTGSSLIRSNNASNANSSPALQIQYDLEISTNFVPDEISLTNVFPAPGSYLTAGTGQRFLGTIRYTLGTAGSATVGLELYDQDGKLVQGSEKVNATRGTYEGQFAISQFVLPSKNGSLTLKAVMRNGSTLLKEVAVEKYLLGNDSIRIVSSYPNSSRIMYAGSQPMVWADDEYMIGSVDAANVFLRVTDDKNTVLGTSAANTLPRGSGVWKKGGVVGGEMGGSAYRCRAGFISRL